MALETQFYSLVDMGEDCGLAHYIFDRKSKTCWQSRWNDKYPEYMRGFKYKSSVGFWPWWWFYDIKKKAE